MYTSSLSGVDTVTYRIFCGADSSEAKVIVDVNASTFVDDVWYFGRKQSGAGQNISAGMRFVKDSQGYKVRGASGESKVNTDENTLVVSSPYCDGQVLFYTSHNSIYNSSHDLITNPEFAGHSSTSDGLAACYMGDNKYLLFSVSLAEGRGDLNAYVIDMDAKNGAGARIKEKDKSIETGGRVSEAIELVAKAGTTDQYWLIYGYCSSSCYDTYTNELRIRSVNVSDPENPVIGIIPSTITSPVVSTGFRYTIKTSPQYDRVVVVNSLSSSNNSLVDVLDFNNDTGTLTRKYTITQTGLNDTYGAAFSPDGNQLYLAQWRKRTDTGSLPSIQQYTLTETRPSSPVTTHQYGSETGGGLKLGPDGKIYVLRSSLPGVGVISDPDNTTALADRYTTLKLSDANIYAYAFSTGLTKPARMACNDNNPPETQADSTYLCLSSTPATATINVLVNDTDTDLNDTVYLTSASFAYALDASLATLKVDPADSTITLTVLPSANISDGHEFHIIYNVKDRGRPASLCATGTLKITAYPLPSVPPTANSINACYDGLPHTASATPADPAQEEIVWYTADGSPVPDPSRTEAGTTTLYAAARNTTTGCESETRTEVTVTVNAYPDAVFDKTQTSVSCDGDSVWTRVCIVNQESTTMSSPIYFSLYRDSVKTENYVKTDSIMIDIQSHERACLSIGAGVDDLYPSVQLVVRLNDRDGVYPDQYECDYSDSVQVRINPAIGLLMKKDATLDGKPYNGRYANPASVLYGDSIEYKITAVNANLHTGDVVIRDTLPLYLDYISGTAKIVDDGNGGDAGDIFFGKTTGTPQDTVIRWEIPGVAPFDTVRVSFSATPARGVSASQPLYINRAWVQVSDTVFVRTNGTYHQGAGVAFVSFSAAAGGSVYNPEPQAIDYRTSPRAGVLVVPDSGYYFAGWSHDEYYSLRGEVIPSAAGIPRLDEIVIYGNVALRADFTPNRYPIRYYLHEGINAPTNPPGYTIEDATITLASPSKEGDVFTGWTGSNGEVPQLTVTIPPHSTGDREYYANYLYSGREVVAPPAEEAGDKIWSAGNEAYIRTSRAGSIVRVYTPDGVLRRQHTIVTPGLTKLRLEAGVYIITLNNNAGQKIVI